MNGAPAKPMSGVARGTLARTRRIVSSTKGTSRAGTSAGVSTTYKRMPREVSRGNRILLSDGLIELRVLSTTSRSVLTEVVNGGLLGEHKGINLPGVKLGIPAVTTKDYDDLVFALQHGANFVAVSFVRRAGSLFSRAAHPPRAAQN